MTENRLRYLVEVALRGAFPNRVFLTVLAENVGCDEDRVLKVLEKMLGDGTVRSPKAFMWEFDEKAHMAALPKRILSVFEAGSLTHPQILNALMVAGYAYTSEDVRIVLDQLICDGQLKPTAYEPAARDEEEPAEPATTGEHKNAVICAFSSPSSALTLSVLAHESGLTPDETRAALHALEREGALSSNAGSRKPGSPTRWSLTRTGAFRWHRLKGELSGTDDSRETRRNIARGALKASKVRITAPLSTRILEAVYTSDGLTVDQLVEILGADTERIHPRLERTVDALLITGAIRYWDGKLLSPEIKDPLNPPGTPEPTGFDLANEQVAKLYETLKELARDTSITIIIGGQKHSESGRDG